MLPEQVHRYVRARLAAASSGGHPGGLALPPAGETHPAAAAQLGGAEGLVEGRLAVAATFSSAQVLSVAHACHPCRHLAQEHLVEGSRPVSVLTVIAEQSLFFFYC